VTRTHLATRLRVKEHSLKPDQWFTLWIALLSVGGGCVAALISVWVGASLALRGNRRSLRQERALTAAERCLAAVDQASDDYRRIGPSMNPHSEATEVQFDNNVIDRVTSAFDNFVNSEVGHEAWLLENRAIMFGIADCLNGSMQLHLDSFLIAALEVEEQNG
jgi:hypothetical protein